MTRPRSNSDPAGLITLGVMAILCGLFANAVHTHDFIVDIWDGQMRNRLDSMAVIAGANVVLLIGVSVVILGIRQLRRRADEKNHRRRA